MVWAGRRKVVPRGGSKGARVKKGDPLYRGPVIRSPPLALRKEGIIEDSKKKRP